MSVQFFVPGIPVPKARPRATQKGKIYTPDVNANFENNVRSRFADKYPDFIPADKALELWVTFRFPIPASAKRKRMPDKIRPKDSMPQKPDLDNLVKSVLDALNAVAFVDDKQVVGIFASKQYGEVPGAFVSLREPPKMEG
jgi:Holliday junction resolvase RusA-like endonuclease